VGEIAERIGAGMGEVELESANAITRRTRRNLTAFLIDYRALRPARTKRSARGAKTRVAGRDDFFVRHTHHMVTHGIGASATIRVQNVTSVRMRASGRQRRLYLCLTGAVDQVMGNAG
jgi:hypothetical protein